TLASRLTLASGLTLASLTLLPPLATPPWPRPPIVPPVPMGSTEPSPPLDRDRSSRTHVCDRQTSPSLQRPPSSQGPSSVPLGWLRPVSVVLEHAKAIPNTHVAPSEVNRRDTLRLPTGSRMVARRGSTS